MALLQMCIEHGVHVEVAHVNYAKRDTAKRDERIVHTFCEKNKIAMHTCYPQMTTHENFQAWARDVRYEFYQKLYDEYHACGLILGHQMDDVLETYFLQEKRASRVGFYGIAPESIHGTMRVYRPLLSLRKHELQAYCDTHHILYGIDESNLTDHYTRNQIRHSLIESATDEQCEMWLAEIREKNKALTAYHQVVDGHVRCLEKWDDVYYHSLEESLRKDVLRAWLLAQHIDKAHDMSDAYIASLDEQCMKEDNFLQELDASWVLEKDYGVLSVQPAFTPYAYQYEILEECETPYFHISFTTGKSVEKVSLSSDDFPIIIRSSQPGDSIELRFGNKKVSRWFIDRKIPVFERKKWPVVLNRKGNIVLVPGIGCDVSHYNDKEGIYVVK